MKEEFEGITRRRFLGTAAATALGTAFLASAGTVAGCSSSPSTASGGKSGGTGISFVDQLNPQDDSYSTNTTDYSAIFEPLTIGKLKLRNRIVKSPAGSDTWVPVGDKLNDNYLDYYENFAKGGSSIVFLESAISKFFSITIKGNTRTVSGWLLKDIQKIPTLMAPVVERVHKHDSYIGFQLAAGTADVATMTVDDIVWLQDLMAQISLQLKNGGFDIIQLHSSATQVMKYFLTARINTRKDKYGADTVENRTRFTCEVIQKIKAACGKDFPVQVLMDACEENDNTLGDDDMYITLEQAVENAKAFEKAGADCFYLRQSVPGMHICQFAPDLMHSGFRCNGVTGYGTMYDFSQHFGGTLEGNRSGCAMLLKATAEFKKNLKSPIAAAGYMDPRTAPDLMNDAIANGQLDYLMITRPLTVDPELPNKLQDGRHDEVAPCCRCMHCHNKGGDASYDYTGKGIELCRVNAATQRAYTDEMPEGYEPTPATKKKKVMVIGGGPAGMEAARIAAQRGHTVTLYEKDSALGGLVREAHAFKGEHERLGDLITYLSHQQDVKGVTVVTGTEVTPETVASEKPDTVIVAVGGKRESKLQGNSTVTVMGIDDIGATPIGDKVVICGGGAQATDCALFLLAQGKKVQIVHSGVRSDIDKEQSTWVRTFLTPQLYAKGVKFWNSSKVKSIDDDGMTITDSMGTQTVLECQTVIECYDMLPNTDLYDALSKKYETYAVGDCKAPFNIAQAIATGNLTARKI